MIQHFQTKVKRCGSFSLLGGRVGGLQLCAELTVHILRKTELEVAQGVMIESTPYHAVIQGQGLGRSSPYVTAHADIYETQGCHDVERERGVQSGTAYADRLAGQCQRHLAGALRAVTAQTVHLGVGDEPGITLQDVMYELLLYQAVCDHRFMLSIIL